MSWTRYDVTGRQLDSPPWGTERLYTEWLTSYMNSRVRCRKMLRCNIAPETLLLPINSHQTMVAPSSGEAIRAMPFVSWNHGRHHRSTYISHPLLHPELSGALRLDALNALGIIVLVQGCYGRTKMYRLPADSDKITWYDELKSENLSLDEAGPTGTKQAGRGLNPEPHNNPGRKRMKTAFAALDDYLVFRVGTRRKECQSPPPNNGIAVATVGSAVGNMRALQRIMHSALNDEHAPLDLAGDQNGFEASLVDVEIVRFSRGKVAAAYFTNEASGIIDGRKEEVIRCLMEYSMYVLSVGHHAAEFTRKPPDGREPLERGSSWQVGPFNRGYLIIRKAVGRFFPSTDFYGLTHVRPDWQPPVAGSQETNGTIPNTAIACAKFALTGVIIENFHVERTYSTGLFRKSTWRTHVEKISKGDSVLGEPSDVFSNANQARMRSVEFSLSILLASTGSRATRYFRCALARGFVIILETTITSSCYHTYNINRRWSLGPN
ncbi:hypothetical protein ACRALDRAFT_212847 [Sodiomyces alcalophilus JCM 7366]|uniref:uncharacterized protein n=1 Tax=Sodiomyces alcalophilus JCM 7366 TaxID=591952 RepID=UPI0039B472BE